MVRQMNSEPSNLGRKILLPAILLIFTLLISAIPIQFSQNLIETARAASNSNGNEAMREIRSGLELTGRTKTEVIKLIGSPKTKNKTPSKGRYSEKWTYSCEDKRGATYNCVFVYFGGDRVKNVELF